MPSYKDASPQLQVRLYKTISRKTVDGQAAVSARYAGRDAFIDLTPYLGDGSNVTTRKSVREPSGAFSIVFADKPLSSVVSSNGPTISAAALETIYGLVESMDVIEIRMWGGVGPQPAIIPIKMRGFVSEVTRSQSMGNDSRPVRTVVISGQDYGKIWQTYQILSLPAYAGGAPLLTNFNMWEMFGITAQNTMSSADFVSVMINKIINPHIAAFMPPQTPMPTGLKIDATVSHGVVNNSYQNAQGSIYDMLKLYGDIGIWNEIFTQDREDGVYVVYRPTPALYITKPANATTRKIQPDAPDPIYVTIAEEDIQSITATRSDANIANFFWVNNQRFDLIDDVYRKLFALSASDQTVNLTEYANSSSEYYGVRAMYGETQQGDDGVTSMTSGLNATEQNARSGQFTAWLDNRRAIMVAMNKDNVVYESGTANIKGGLMRPAANNGTAEHMQAGDYARFDMGNIEYEAYIVEITDEYAPYQGYRANITFERGTGFITRSQMGAGVNSPWLAEQATKTGNPFGKIS